MDVNGKNALENGVRAIRFFAQECLASGLPLIAVFRIESSDGLRFFGAEFSGFIPKLEVAMKMYCRFCGFSYFCTSHFRFRARELPQLLMLRFPVRCINCNERVFTSLKNFLQVRGEREERRRMSQNEE
jgi:hypothetical protein